MEIETFDWTDKYKDIDALLDSINFNDDWSNEPGAIYAEHEHPYDKTLYCLEGSVLFTVNEEKYQITAGQGLQLPRNTLHGAVVGTDGTRCIEVHVV